MLLLAISQWLAGEVERADDLLAEVAEEGLERGAPESLAVALGERAAIAIERGAWVQAEELADRALRVIGQSRMDEYPTSAFLSAVAARVALHRGDATRAHALLARAHARGHGSPMRCRTSRYRPASSWPEPTSTIADAGGARTMLREIEAVLRRQPDLGVLPAQVEELRVEPEDHARQRPRNLDPDAAELRLLPTSPRTCHSRRSASAGTSRATQ